MIKLLGEVISFVVDDLLHIFKVDVALDDNEHIVQVTCISENDFADILAITPCKYSLLIVMLLFGHKFLIIA